MPGHECATSYFIVAFYVHLVKLRGHCSFCWYLKRIWRLQIQKGNTWLLKKLAKRYLDIQICFLKASILSAIFGHVHCMISFHSNKPLYIVWLVSIATSHIVFLIFNDLMVFNATFNNISVITWRSVLLTSQWFSPGTSVSSTNKTDCHNTTETKIKISFVFPNPTLPARCG